MPPKPNKKIFVIMPFSTSPTRTQEELTDFFENSLKAPIEEDGTLAARYNVTRSGDAFHITEQIIKDLQEADFVICDLSGRDANPNVMYELGVRMAISDEPVILIREEHTDNKQIFDVAGFFHYSYSTSNYASLRAHLLKKIGDYESGEQYQSPVRRIVEGSDDVQAEVARVRSTTALLMYQSNPKSSL